MPSGKEEMTVDKKMIEGLLAAAIREIIARPKSATAWLESRDPDLSLFSKAIDNENACGCGGRDGIVVLVPKSDKPKIRGMLVVSAFSHHQGDDATSAFITAEDAKQLVNTLGEAIAVAERELADVAAGGKL